MSENVIVTCHWLKILQSHPDGEDPERLTAWAPDNFDWRSLWLQHNPMPLHIFRSWIPELIPQMARGISLAALFIAHKHYTSCNIAYILFGGGGGGDRCLCWCCFLFQNEISPWHGDVVLCWTGVWKLPADCFYCTLRTKGQYLPPKAPWGSRAK